MRALEGKLQVKKDANGKWKLDDFAAKYKINAIASPLLIGGWRLTLQNAFIAMLEGYEKARRNNVNGNLEIHMMNYSNYRSIKTMAQ